MRMFLLTHERAAKLLRNRDVTNVNPDESAAVVV